MRLRPLFLALCLLPTLLVGCGGGQQSSEELRIARDQFLGRSDDRAVERASAQALYNTARGFLDSGDPKRALDIYAKLQTKYPFTPYATQASLETIYAHYRAREFQAAVAAADRFIKQHPRHTHIDYVYYLRGLINYNRSGSEAVSFISGDSTQRDPTHLRQAFTDFNLLIQNYPNSIYLKDAQLHMIEIRNRLANYELQVAEYYLTRRAWVAASRRAQQVVDRYQGTDSVPRALEIMETSYRRLGLDDMAQDTQTILQVSYPNYVLNRREFYRQRAGLKPHYKLPPMDAQPPSAESQRDSAGTPAGQSGNG